MTAANSIPTKTLKKADWELDFYSRPIIESDGKKRWELLICTTQNFSREEPFRWEKKCPAGEVNSIWLAKSLQEAIEQANKEGWDSPSRIRFWRPSMRTIIKKASENLGIDPIASRRTYSLIEWLQQRSIEIYPNETGYLAGPIAPPFTPILNQPTPLPEAVRGEAWSFATLPVGVMREAEEWPIEFRSLIPIKKTINDLIEIPGIRLFSKSRSLGLAASLSGLEPVLLSQVNSQLILESGQDERWLVTDMDKETTKYASQCFENSKRNAEGLQFIAVQSTPQEEKFTGFWMLKDLAFE